VMFSVPHPIREGSVRATAMKDHAGSP
jgi:hypothetical protein